MRRTHLPAIAATVTLLYGAQRSLEFLSRFPVVTPSPAPLPAAPLVSILVPARNEELNIARCVCSLLAQDYPAYEVIVIDDESTDATPAILAGLAAQDARLQILRSRPLPAGWTGKSHALAQAACQARGEWLLFVDADTVMAPVALRAAMALARERHADLLTLWVYQELESFWERTVMPVVLAINSVVDPHHHISDPRFPEAAIANGQFILVRRAAYGAVGGHAAARGTVLEDHILARAIKAAGYRLLLADGAAVVRTRMYRTLGALWEGWSKNQFAAVYHRLDLAIVGVVGIGAAILMPFGMLLGGLISSVRARRITALLLYGLVQMAALNHVRRRYRRYFEMPLRNFLFAPLGAIVYIGTLCNSTYRHLSGTGVRWRGRVY